MSTVGFQPSDYEFQLYNLRHGIDWLGPLKNKVYTYVLQIDISSTRGASRWNQIHTYPNFLKH